MYSKSFFAAAAACGLLASTVNAHMVITSPVPYGQDSLTNSPLAADGSDFPCKQRAGVYDVSTMNNIAVGVPQKLEFQGGATHGGGSCQLSVTLDKEPTKASKWKVVHSILGGCPNGAAGNANGSPTYNQNPSFEWSMPKEMPNGEYTLAWTWFNKIGNREMYMNCAPITVTGGSDNDDVLNSLPDMFVANVPASECETVEGQDLVFPNPGLYVETAGSALGNKLVGACTAGGAGSGGSGPAPTSAAETPSSAAATPTGSPAEGGYPSISIPGPKANDPSATLDLGTPAPTLDVVTSTTMATVTGSAPTPTYAAPVDETEPTEPTGGNGTTPSGSCTGGSVSCDTPGAVVCIGADQWGLCDINNCAVPRALSAGTACSSGVVSKRSRHLAHLKRHLGHRANSS